MAKVNKVEIEGKVYNGQTRTLKENKIMCMFSVNFASKKNCDNWENQYVNVKCFDMEAPPKGAYVKVFGRLAQYKYKNKEGVEVSGIEVIADKIESQEVKKQEPVDMFDEIKF